MSKKEIKEYVKINLKEGKSKNLIYEELVEKYPEQKKYIINNINGMLTNSVKNNKIFFILKNTLLSFFVIRIILVIMLLIPLYIFQPPLIVFIMIISIIFDILFFIYIKKDSHLAYMILGWWLFLWLFLFENKVTMSLFQGVNMENAHSIIDLIQLIIIIVIITGFFNVEKKNFMEYIKESAKKIKI